MQPTTERLNPPPISTAAPAAVSVAITCFNQGRYLRDAIESVLAQTHPPSEVLVVDDGSTDETADVAAAFSGVRYIRQHNRGLSAARNTGLRAATGDLVVFLDADDRLLPGAIDSGVKCFEEHPDCALVFGAFRNISDDGSAAPTAPQELVKTDHYWRMLQGNFIGMHGAVLYRRSALLDAGGFNETLRACEDYELYLRIARRHAVEQHTAVVAEYRKHHCNMSRDHAFMLHSVLEVLSLERKKIRDRRNVRAAHAGVRIWKEYYGNLLFNEWKQRPTAGGFLRILSLWPSGTLRKAAVALARRLRARPTRFGSLRRTEPFSRQFGFDRGTPVDRYYIESFLNDHSEDVRGHVLEIGDDSYSRRFGAEGITRQDILHVVAGSAGATIIADLANAPQILSDTFDCIILTQTLHYIFDLRAAAETLYRILKPGGILLVTLPGISAVCRDQEDKEADCWRFTVSSARRLFSSRFRSENVRVRSYGNVLSAVAFLEGLPAGELRPGELHHYDADYPVTVAVRAVKG
jgi:glycosyltransferase involved in cell wall biosynthesis